MKFINRERELKALERFWQESQSPLIVIYGKRRIGKTELIKHFIKQKPYIYFLAQKIKEHENYSPCGII
ncbi:MAG: ATP-binding protein [Candidatus Cloacimonetes bacterium]|nr:ATP-binding protein [Candidatus Cloacimonadota bacterium]MCK4359049.1 ATP-binding protein [Candidatus Cloacimonadota bacterium]